MKKILFYSQHLAGIGHLVRSTAIIQHLAQHFEVTLVHGGQAVPGLPPPSNVSQIPLPALYMEGPALKVVDDMHPLEKVQEQRQAELLAAFDQIQPDCLITEGFPFSKHTLRFELIPLLKHAQASRQPTRVVCCLRDIIMTQAMSDRVRAKKQNRTCEWLNRYYDLILYHSDAQLQRLEENFPRLNELDPEVFYTGYVIPSEPIASSFSEADRHALSQTTPSIVASVGGGRHGYELLQAIATLAPALAPHLPHTFHVFTGPYLPAADLWALQAQAANCPNLEVRRFTPHLMDYLNRADLSISLGGYNTTLNILKTGVRSLIYPSPSTDQSGEQSLRAHKLEQRGLLTVIGEADLAPEPLTQHILKALQQPRKEHSFKLDGAPATAAKLQQFLNAEPDPKGSLRDDFALEKSLSTMGVRLT
jgi:predicted glycosyltransferase